MSFHYEVNGNKVIFNFDRRTTQAFAELLKRNEGEKCKIEDPVFGKKELTGYIDEVSFIPSKTTKYAETSWIVEVELDDVLGELVRGTELKLPQNINYFCGNMVMGAPVFHRVYSVSLTTSTDYEVFEDLQIPDTTKASATWDHKKSINFVLFQQKKVFVKKNFTEMPWAESSLDGASILIATTKKDKNGRREYTELGLAMDGWTYSSDLTSDEKYDEMPLADAIKFVKSSVIQANHNP